MNDSPDAIVRVCLRLLYRLGVEVRILSLVVRLCRAGRLRIPLMSFRARLSELTLLWTLGLVMVL